MFRKIAQHLLVLSLIFYIVTVILTRNFLSFLALINIGLFVISLVYLIIYQGKKIIVEFNYKSSVKSLLVIIVLIAIYLLCQNSRIKIDLKNSRQIKLTTESLQIIEEIKSPLTINILFGVKGYSEDKYNFLKKLFEQNSKYIKFNLIDPAQQLDLVDTKWKLISGDVFIIEDANGKTQSGSELSEQELLDKIRLFIESKVKIKILDLDGLFSESVNPDGFFKLGEALKKNGYEYEVVHNLSDLALTDFAIILPFQEFNVKKSEFKFPNRSIVLIDPIFGAGISSELSKFSISYQNDLVVDQLVGSAGVTPEIVWQVNSVVSDPSNEITSNLKGVNPIFLMAGSLKLSGDKTKALLESGVNSWGETNLKLLLDERPAALKEDNDFSGPLTLAASYKSDNQKIIVVSDLEWLRNANFDLQNHKKLLMTALRWVLDKKIDLSAKSSIPEIKLLSINTYHRILLFGLILSEVLVLIGIMVVSFRASNVR